jgi:hypothetical protein
MPEGGTVTIEGVARREYVRDTRTMTSTVTATKTAAACSYKLPGGATIAVTGNPNIAVEAQRKRVEGVPTGCRR